MTPADFEKLNKLHPYLTYVRFQDEDLVGIVQNVDSSLLSLYVYNHLKTDASKKRFLACGEIWWNDSNRMVPINIFLRHDFYEFKSVLRCLSKKDIETVLGPTNSLEDNFQKRIKRKRIQLIKKS